MRAPSGDQTAGEYAFLLNVKRVRRSPARSSIQRSPGTLYGASFATARSPFGDNTIPIKFELTDQSGRNLSSRRIDVQALCVVPTPASNTDPCSNAPAGFNWTRGTPYVASLGPDSRYQVNVKTKGLDAGKTYQLLFRAAGEPNTIYHADANAAFTLSR